MSGADSDVTHLAGPAATYHSVVTGHPRQGMSATTVLCVRKGDQVRWKWLQALSASQDKVETRAQTVLNALNLSVRHS